ncbi:hypothetical protein Tcan_16075 [Toxocara canis]|uniref:Uncharacterized protein n=1 Tax=Toxocara canis TaxID=6265 RepID=A0A0B2V1W1_TOXCA|nr:hypothetical protein Tcan_16075 [Toxocara canis]
MRSVATLAISVLSLVLGERIFQKDEVVKLEADSGILAELASGARNCDPQIYLGASDKLKAFARLLPHVDHGNASTARDCISPLRKYAGGSRLLIRYRHQISYEVIVRSCNVTGLSIKSAIKEGKKVNYLMCKLRCNEIRRSQHRCFVEYFFAVIFACATVGACLTTFAHFCRTSEKGSATKGTSPHVSGGGPAQQNGASDSNATDRPSNAND